MPGPAGARRPSTNALRVINIAGKGRSGSTLLARLLALSPGVVAVGEGLSLWRGFGHEARTCGCRRPFAECDFWGAVARAGFAGRDRIDGDSWFRQEFRAAFTANPIAVRWPRLLPARARARGEAAASRKLTLYRAIASASGATVLVDATKNWRYSNWLASLPGLDVRCVHLVRDPRAVAMSHRRNYPPTAQEPRGFGRRRTARASARQWVTRNAGVEAVWLFSPRCLRVRYEDLAIDPVRVLRRIADFAGTERPPIMRGHPVDFPLQHLASGNQFRFQHGPTEIRLDDAWRTELPAPERRLVTAMTLPFMLRYGYIGRPARRRPRTAAARAAGRT